MAILEGKAEEVMRGYQSIITTLSLMGTKDTIASSGKPYQVGQTFQVIYYPMDPTIFSLKAQKDDSAIAIFWNGLSFLALFSLVFTIGMTAILVYFTWTIINKML